MADEFPTTAVQAAESSASSSIEPPKKSPKKIPGNLTYINNFRSIKPVLDKLIEASKPEKFSQTYLATVLKLSGGSYRAVIPVLKRVGFLTSDGTPTELYSKFRTESGRAEAAYGALKAGFAELFKRNEHVYAANDARLTDLIVEVTGRAKTEPVIGAIRGTFRVFSQYLPNDFSPTTARASVGSENGGDALREEEVAVRQSTPGMENQGTPLNLAYNINVIIPETKDVEVLNAIFRSLRENLLR